MFLKYGVFFLGGWLCLDPASCASTDSTMKKCTTYMNEGTCVSACTAGMFVDVPIPNGEAVCLSACPIDRPYYNDTRILLPNGQFATFTILESLCAGDCSTLNPHVYASLAPYRCSTLDQIAADKVALNPAPSTGAGTSNLTYGLSIGLGGFTFLLIIVIITMKIHRNSIRHNVYGFTDEPMDVAMKGSVRYQTDTMSPFTDMV